MSTLIYDDKILELNKKLIELAEILTEKEVIFEGDLQKIFGERPFSKKVDTSQEATAAPDKEKPEAEITEENPK